jgi:hypothetical protein
MRRFAEVSATINIWLAVGSICGSAIAYRLFIPSRSGRLDALLGLLCLTVVSLGILSTATAWRRPEAATTDPPEERGGGHA